MISGKILLVDDQPTAAQASIDALTNFVSKDQILYASTAAQAIQILDSTPLAAAFLDIDMPDTKNFLWRNTSTKSTKVCLMCF